MLSSNPVFHWIFFLHVRTYSSTLNGTYAAKHQPHTHVYIMHSKTMQVGKQKIHIMPWKSYKSTNIWICLFWYSMAKTPLCFSPGGHAMGRMAGTGTAVEGTGTTDDAGCQLRCRFFGGPDDMADETTRSEAQPNEPVNKLVLSLCLWV